MENNVEELFDKQFIISAKVYNIYAEKGYVVSSQKIMAKNEKEAKLKAVKYYEKNYGGTNYEKESILVELRTEKTK